MNENLIMTDEVSEFRKMMLSRYGVWEVNFNKEFKVTSSKQFKNNPEFVRLSKVRFAWDVWIENSCIKKAQYNRLLDACHNSGESS